MCSRTLAVGVVVTLLCLYGCGGPDEESLSRIRQLEERVAELAAKTDVQSENLDMHVAELQELKKILSGEKVAGVIKANRLCVVDKDGRERAWLHITTQGGVSLEFADQETNVVTSLGVHGIPTETATEGMSDAEMMACLRAAVAADSGYVDIKDQRGTRVGIGAFGIGLYGPDGEWRASFATFGTGTSLRLRDSEWNNRVTLEVSEKDTPALWMTDKAGKAAAGMCVDSNMPSVLLFDQSEKCRAYLKLGEDGKPSMSLSDAERPRATLGCTPLEITKTGATERTAESSLVLFDKEGKVLYQLPP